MKKMKMKTTIERSSCTPNRQKRDAEITNAQRNTMLLRGLLFSVILLVNIDLSHSKIAVIGRSNAEASVGGHVLLLCTIEDPGTNFTVEWQHVPLGSTSSVTVNRDKIIISASCASRCSVEGFRESGEYSLSIRNVTLTDAGKYTCVDIRDSSRAEVQLIVFDSYPSPQFCTVAAAATGADGIVVGSNSCGIQPDTVSLSCLMSYKGAREPKMVWSSTSSKGHRVSVLTMGGNLTVNADEITDDNNFTCSVKYPNSEATSKFSWTLSLNVFSNRTRLVEVNDSQPRIIDCTLKTAHICRYSWTFKDTNGERVSSESTLDLNDLQSGVYICSAECTIRGTTCTVEPVKVSYMPTKGQRMSYYYGAIVAAIVTTVSVVVVAVCLIAVVYFHRRTKTKQPNEKTKLEGDSKIEDPVKSEDKISEEVLPEDITTREIKPMDDEIANSHKKESVQPPADSDLDVDMSGYVLVELKEDAIEERVEYPLAKK